MLALADQLWQDVRYAIKTWVRKPGLMAVATLTLALGIGATTAMYAAIDGVLLRPLPYRDGARLLWVWSVDGQSSLKQRVSGDGVPSGNAMGRRGHSNRSTTVVKTLVMHRLGPFNRAGQRQSIAWKNADDKGGSS